MASFWCKKVAKSFTNSTSKLTKLDLFWFVGSTNVVLDIRAENLDQQLDTRGSFLNDSEIAEKLEQIDISKPIELVALNNSESVKKTIKTIYDKCEQKSLQKPRILADKKILNLITR